MHWRLVSISSALAASPSRLLWRLRPRRRLRLRLFESQFSYNFTTNEPSVKSDWSTCDTQPILVGNSPKHLMLADVALRRLTALVAEAASCYVEDAPRAVHGHVVVKKQFNEPSSKTAKMARKEARHGKRGNERRNAKLLH